MSIYKQSQYLDNRGSSYSGVSRHPSSTDTPLQWTPLLRPVYTGDFCCDLSPFDACDLLTRPYVQSYINQYFCDSSTQSHASE